MQRREFIVGLGAAITGSIRTDAQGLPSLSLVGYLDDDPVEALQYRPAGIGLFGVRSRNRFVSHVGNQAGQRGPLGWVVIEDTGGK